MTFRRNTAVTLGTAIALLSLSLPAFQPALALTKDEHNVPKGIELAADRGRVDPIQELNLTVVLKMHNEAAFDKVLEDLYNPESPGYHHWLTASDLERYAPTPSEFETVKKELVSHGFTVLSSDPQRFSIRVHGTAGIAEEAFQTELHTFSYNGRTFRAHIRDAHLTGEAGKLVEAVAGLERHEARPMLTVASDPRTGKPLYKTPAVAEDLKSTLQKTTTSTALSPAEEFTYTTPGASLPVGIFYGNVYDINPKLNVCLSPTKLQRHYGLTPLIGAGYDGSGQTIALVEAYGYAAAKSDANAIAAAYGLPALTSSNFSVIYPEGPPLDPNAADLTGWTTEIALDIQSAHAIAPGANILVVASAGQDNEDQIASLQYIINHKLAYTVSSSWENDDEIISGSAEENAFNNVLKRGAAAGISFQFSTGDGGDLGLGTPIGDVMVPSNSPWATAVGGTSILNNPYGKGDVVAGWGNDAAYLNLGGVVDPPFSFFLGGAGGGESVYFSKPSWQHLLAGTGRQVPDVSALADPYTGVAVFVTERGTHYLLEGVGGTSLASPIFTAIWAIADQYNGAPLGHAGQAVPKLKAGQITDVLPTSDLNARDVTGTIIDSKGATFYSATGLFAGAGSAQTEFPSAIWNLSSQEGVALSFGTDSSLTVTPGWDNVTGFGEPNGLPFIQGVSGKTTGAALTK